MAQGFGTIVVPKSKKHRKKTQVDCEMTEAETLLYAFVALCGMGALQDVWSSSRHRLAVVGLVCGGSTAHGEAEGRAETYFCSRFGEEGA